MDPCSWRRDWMKNVEERRMSYESLKAMTDNFSNERLLGSGAFGKVYKGVQSNGDEIAVKVLRDMAALDEKNFMNEFQNLARLKHPNIVQLVGFCNESKKQIFVCDDGTKLNAEKMHVALCFEYIDNGSLHEHISGECRLQWHIRYKIIKGICEGLKHLSEGLESPIWHLDLKPMNILLDKEMIVKIADFGLSRLIGDDITRKTLSSVGTCGYLPPEYIRFQLLSKEFDIFSLGVIITKIMVGDEGYNSCADMPRQELVKHVHKIWEKKLRETVRHGSLDVYCQQVKTCIEIASKCLMEDRRKRPTIQEIIIALNETEIRAPATPLQIEQFYEAESIFASNPSINFMSPSGSDGEAGGSGYTNNRSTHPYVQAKFPYELVREMTNNFSEDWLLGHGNFGKVYKGVYEDGQAIAVKVPTYSDGVDAKQFENEVENISKLKHKNIVQTVGYSCETKELPVEYNGRMVIAERRVMVICLEYLEYGSLERHISDEYHGLDWSKRYKIIKGICEGLHYLHKQSPSPVLHLDLKPSNILLDNELVPKISDFGLSRLWGEEHILHKLTPTPSRTLGYLPPEYINKGVISMKHDIYSLGVIIIEVLTGRRAEDSSPQVFIEPVLRNWRTRLQTTSKGRSLEGYCRQVEASLKIALHCLEPDKRRRPDIGDVVHVLTKIETSIHDGGELLDLQPMELRFRFHPRKYASCLLQLRNMELSHVAFKLLPKSHRRKYLTKLPLYGIVPPRCTYTLVLTSGKQLQRSLSDSDEGFVVQSITVRNHQELQLQYLESIFKKSQESAHDEVQEVTLKCIYDPTDEEASSSSSPSSQTRPEIEIITRPDAREVTSIQVHPTKPWIMTTHQGGNLRIWNYKIMEMLNPIKVPDESVYVAKFMTQAEWVVAGDGNGCIHVCSYDDSQEYTSFEGHNGQIMSLAVHPTDSYVLSSSHEDHLIKLWQWDKSWDFDMDPWVCTRIFEGHSNKVPQLIFNPDGTGSFASASWDGTVKIWDPNSDVCNTVTLEMHPDGLLCVDFITGADHQHLVTVSKDQTVKIWDVEINKCREYLQGHANHASVVYCRKDLKKLITCSIDGSIRIWDSSTYRLENIVAPNLGAVSDVGYIQELQRIAVGCHEGIAMMEIKFP